MQKDWLQYSDTYEEELQGNVIFYSHNALEV